MSSDKFLPGRLKAADVAVYTDLSVDTQKDWQKKIAALGLVPLGQENGHRRYSRIDLLFFELIKRIKESGIEVSIALMGTLRDRNPPELPMPGMLDIRQRLFLTFATYGLGYTTDSDIKLFIPRQGHFQPKPQWILSSRHDDRGIALGADPSIDEAAVSKAFYADEMVTVINISRMVWLFEEYAKVIDEALDHAYEQRRQLEDLFGINA